MNIPKALTPAIIEQVAQKEGVPVDTIKAGIQSGKHVILVNPIHSNVKPVAVGEGLRVKMNANIGVSPACSSLEAELEKVKLCERYDVDCIMDLSLGDDSRRIRREIVAASSMPVGTVPLYELFFRHSDYPQNMIEPFLEILEENGKDGVDFVVIHAGLLMEHLELVKSRLIKVTSRGGSMLIRWMEKFQKENFLFTHFDQILDVCKRYNMTISLGDGMRPATIIDETDEAQIQELKNIGQLVLRCREAGVQSMVEGPGHIPAHKIALNVQLQKEYCFGAPFYILGPLVTDIGAGYDHITAAIGATIAGMAGADFLCYVTPSEHLSSPSLADVKDGIIAFKIAAHAVDLTRGKDWDRDRKMSEARGKLDWPTQKATALDPDSFDKYRKNIPAGLDACTMCGEFCALK